MSFIQQSNYGETPFQDVLGHIPDLLIKWNDLSDFLTKEGSLSVNLKEEVRRVLAYGNKCRYCMAKGKPNMKIKDEEIQIATAFADLFLNYRSSINEAHFNILRTVFNERQIVELCVFICFTTASQSLGAITNL
ncbi:carboxymuconolactone decarboxylase family protein [Alkalicoccobacillus gibsonii]|uniref:carboxymuconolactone decarboxylase family protein n=1 Tax=Alkalicoccobacillus gibsonii TaxID=79881 RepID=UPI001934A0DE|nr:carboxymuconolactone decarboxylase family protein [Alkalicoccobacillus gibsonii]MBM0066350.1 carboxymuconolactone decarboxylase family protein [Alkalicoccobacillus gibsonii]